MSDIKTILTEHGWIEGHPDDGQRLATRRALCQTIIWQRAQISDLESQVMLLGARAREAEKIANGASGGRIETMLERETCTLDERSVLEACRDAKIVCPPDCYPYFENEHPVAIAECVRRRASKNNQVKP